MFDANAHCCSMMAIYAEWTCRDVDRVHDGDPLDCPDRLVERRADLSYGLIVHDGGGSAVQMRFCPWCGSSLPEPRLGWSFEPDEVHDGSSRMPGRTISLD